MRKPSEVIAIAIQLEAYAPQFVGRVDSDYHRYQPFLCNVIKHCGEFEQDERYHAVIAIRSKLDGHETLYSFWIHNVSRMCGAEFTREWCIQFWAEFVTELQSQGR